MSAYSSTSHEMTTAVERAMQTGGVVDEHGNLVTKFTFSLIDLVREIKTERLKADALSRLQFSIDGFISGALSRMLNQFYQFSKTEASLTNWASYGDFLRHIEGIEHTEQALYEAGCDVSDTVARIRNLVTFRSELHYVSASQLSDPSTYDAPRLVDVLSKPRMRNLSAAAELGLQAIVEDDTDDKELQAELLAQYKLDDRLERMNQHRMDMMRAKSLVVLFSCLPIDEDAPVDDETDAFFRMDARTQYSLLGATLRAVTETRRKAVTDNRLPIMEKGALRVEAKALMATLTTALEHWSFADIAS
jgi:hypothetical protein